MKVPDAKFKKNFPNYAALTNGKSPTIWSIQYNDALISEATSDLWDGTSQIVMTVSVFFLQMIEMCLRGRGRWISPVTFLQTWTSESTQLEYSSIIINYCKPIG